VLETRVAIMLAENREKFALACNLQNPPRLLLRRSIMQITPSDENPVRSHGKMQGKIVLITGDDVDMGRSVAMLFAREGADIIINYPPKKQREMVDTVRYVRAEGGRCFVVSGNLQDIAASKVVIEKSLKPFGRIDILISSRSHTETPVSEDLERDLYSWWYWHSWPGDTEKSQGGVGSPVPTYKEKTKPSRDLTELAWISEQYAHWIG
jgi:hypothetical protein